MKTCLLVIDVQESFTRRPYYSAVDVASFLASQNELISGCLVAGVPVVRVFHVEPGGADHPFAMASGLVRPLPGLMPFTEALVVHKTRHSALVGTELLVWLIQHGVQRLIVSGIRTEQCCETTTRHGSDLGFDVIFVPEATLTFEMRLPDGSAFLPADIKARTASVLAGRFAEVMGVQRALAAVADLTPA